MLAFNGKVCPFKPSLIIVGIPPMLVAIQGSPKEFASPKTCGEKSAFEGMIKK
jgi:hypothetical protein